MTPHRLRYLRFLKGLRMFQNIIRMRKLVVQSEADRANERYTFRICLHDIKMIIEGSRDTFPALQAPHIVGELNSVSFDKMFGINRQANPIVEEKDRPIVDLLSEGLADVGSGYAKSYRNIQVLAKGTVFLTLSIHEHMLDSNNPEATHYYRRPMQLCRYDLLLKEDKVVRLKPSMLLKFGYRDLSPELIERVCREHSVASYKPLKPFLMIPYSRANAEVRITISEVTDWPKALVLGQTAYNIKYFVTRHRVMR